MTSQKSVESKQGRIGLRQQVLLAALECSGGDLRREFTAEDLLLAAWKRDPMSWGLRGHEIEHPDSERIYVEIDRASVRGGIVGLGLLEKVRQRTYRLTPVGLAAASDVAGADPSFRGKAERALADALATILSHPVFRDWLSDAALPKHFRDAGHFWNIAAGTPPRVIRARIAEVDKTLQKAKELLEQKSVDEIAARRGEVLFDRTDLARAQEFQQTLKERFAKDLATLQVGLLELTPPSRSHT